MDIKNRKNRWIYGKTVLKDFYEVRRDGTTSGGIDKAPSRYGLRLIAYRKQDGIPFG